MDKDTEGLSSAEQAYFDSRGEAEITIPADEPSATPEVEPQPSQAEPEAEGEIDAELAEIDAESEPEKPTGQSKVPLAALTKTRAEVKAEREKRVEIEKQNAVLMDRLQRIIEAQQQPEQPPQPETIPDPDTDPVGALKWAAEQIKAQKAREAEQAQMTEAQRREQAEWQQVVSVVETDYTAAVSEDPTIKQAHEYLLNSQGEEFLAMGMSREEAQAEITRIERAHIKFAAQRGIKIGPYLQALAKARGFRAQAPAPAAPAVDPAKQLEALSAAVEGSASLSAAGGGAPAITTAETVANMSADDFEKWLSKNPKAFKRLAGG